MKMTKLYTDEHGNTFEVTPDAEWRYNRQVQANLRDAGRAAFLTVNAPYVPCVTPSFITKVKQVLLGNPRLYREVSYVYKVKDTTEYQAHLWVAMADSTFPQLMELISIINTSDKYAAYPVHQSVPLHACTFVIIDKIPNNSENMVAYLNELIVDRFYHIYHLGKHGNTRVKLETVSENTLKSLGKFDSDTYMWREYRATPVNN